MNPEFLSQRITLLGLGIFSGGAGAARFFAMRGAEVTVTDRKTAGELQSSIDTLSAWPAIRYVLGTHRDEDITTADLVVVSPAIPDRNPFVQLAQQLGIPLTTEINLVFERCPAPIIGITGSNGKTTTTSLTGALLEAQDARVLVGGNIGRSILNDLDETVPDTPVVLELSSFQLHRLSWTASSPHIAVITNITPNHLDWHETYAAYVHAKQHIVRYQNQDDLAILNADDEAIRSWGPLCPGRVFWFSIDRPVEIGCFLRDGHIIYRDETNEQRVCPVEMLRLPGRHNLSNALAAVTVACVCGLPAALIQQVVADFRGVAHRLEGVAKKGGVGYYNDSACTTPTSTIIALQAFDRALVLIAGGSDKGTPFDEMAAEIVQHTRAVVLIGDTAEAIEHAIRQQPVSPPVIVHAVSMEDAVARSAELARSGDVVVLSPACASFGMFTNFEDRGRQFKAAVEGLHPV